MYLSTKIIVTIDPVEDIEVLNKYKNSKEWHIIAETSYCYVFEKASSIIQSKAFFVDDEKEGDSG